MTFKHDCTFLGRGLLATYIVGVKHVTSLYTLSNKTTTRKTLKWSLELFIII